MTAPKRPDVEGIRLALTAYHPVEPLVGWTDDLLAYLAHLEAQNERLRRFAGWAIMEGPFQGYDLDGGSVQDAAQEHGLIAEVPGGYDPDVHAEEDLERGDTYYTLAFEVPS